MINIKLGNVLEVNAPLVCIVHCTNNIGLFGSGIAGEIRRIFPNVAKRYEEWYSNTNTSVEDTVFEGNWGLGEIQIVRATPTKLICNLIGQKDVGQIYISKNVSLPPIKYEAIHEGMLRLREYILENYPNGDIEILSPLLGCGLAKGSLVKIYQIVYKVFNSSNINYTFFAFSDEDYVRLKDVHASFKLLTSI